jgi:hypothetical protein
METHYVSATKTNRLVLFWDIICLLRESSCETHIQCGMVSSGLLRRVALVRTDVSEEPGACFIRVTKSVHWEQHKLQLATDVRCEEIPSETGS